MNTQNRMRSVHRTFRALNFLTNVRPSPALLGRTRFRSIRRSEIYMNIKVDLHGPNRHWRRFCVWRILLHIYQEQWRQ